MQIRYLLAAGALASLLSIPAISAAEAVFDPDGPFRPGEGFGTPVTCDTIGDWIDRVPDYEGRISMVITDILVDTHWDGALAYLIMCEPEGIQVMCVTYSLSEVDGQPVMLAGGYNRVGERQIMLDPCLAYPPE